MDMTATIRVCLLCGSMGNQVGRPYTWNLHLKPDISDIMMVQICRVELKRFRRYFGCSSARGEKVLR